MRIAVPSRGRLGRSVGRWRTDEPTQGPVSATSGLWWESCRFAPLILGLTMLERVQDAEISNDKNASEHH
jgi:hypothetical protein